MTGRITAFLIVLLVSAGCGNRKAEQPAALPFPAITLPAMMDDRDESVRYLAEHWWDNFTATDRTYPSDTSLVDGVAFQEVEQKFADWVSVVGMVDMSHARKSVNRLYERSLACEKKDSSSNVFETMIKLMDKYLYDPNSPVRNEDVYGFLVERLASCDRVVPDIRKRYEREARLCALNRVGTKAADFRFTDRRGKTYSLYGIDAPMILLFFSNPGCNACMDIINGLKGSPVISSMISAGTLAVLNIYIDEDIAAWRDYMPVYPEEWYNGFDPDYVIRTDMLYNVRAIPSLYLLDEDKTVIMKDAPESRVFSFIEGQAF
ncbi:MAG: DUF5106 domain-containing protein [Bacteroidales bacterium]|nr:DUF5106 domain-containing protein [Bacteroidales bacterium]